jgi:hypothetical protein
MSLIAFNWSNEKAAYLAAFLAFGVFGGLYAAIFPSDFSNRSLSSSQPNLRAVSRLGRNHLLKLFHESLQFLNLVCRGSESINRLR